MIDEDTDLRIRRLENGEMSTYDLFTEIQSDIKDVHVQTRRLVERADRTDKRLQEMQDNLNRRFAKVEERFDKVERFNAVDDRFNAVDERFNAVDERFNAVDERFNAVDERFNSVDTSSRDDEHDAGRDSVSASGTGLSRVTTDGTGAHPDRMRASLRTIAKSDACASL